MKILANYSEAPAKSFDTDAIQGVRARVVIGKDDGAAKFCMRVFEVEKGGFAPRHSHDWEHEIFIHQGRGQVFRNDGWVDVQAGSVVFIPGNEEHQIRNAGDSKLVFVCLIPAGPAEL
jgi:quercetin dioxygenase-like cupin family protein